MQASELIPILHFDLVGFSQSSADHRAMLLQQLQKLVTAATRFIMPFGDLWKKWSRQGTGDGYYLFLDGLGPRIALQVVLNLEAEVAGWNRRTPEMPLRMRITLCYGRVGMVEDQYFGDALIESARLLDSMELRNLEAQLWETGLTCALALTIPFYIALNNDSESKIQLVKLDWDDVKVTDKHDKIHHGKFRRYSNIDSQLISGWTAAQREGSSKLNEAKLLFVGAGGAGKTSLIRTLKGQGFNPEECQTQGVVVNNVKFTCKGVDIKCHLWDFGGQEIMHSTHQFFLSRRSMYFLVIDTRSAVSNVDYWLKLIESFGEGCPVFVVLSKADENRGFDLNRKSLRDKYPCIQGFYQVSNKTGLGVSDLKEAIISTLPTMELVRNQWPHSWLAIKNTLEKMTDKYIDLDQFRSLCIKKGVEQKKHQDDLMAYLHELGIALHYPELEWLNTQVLKPDWVTEPVYALITHPEIGLNHGLFSKVDLPRLLPQFPKNKYSFLCQLMDRFEICHPRGSDLMLFPDLLLRSKPDLPFEDADSLRLDIEYHFLPRSILPRLMVRQHREIQAGDNGLYQWREGVLFKHSALNSQVLVQADYDLNQITLQAQGVHGRLYLITILDCLRDIQSSYQKIEAQELVRCVCIDCKNDLQPHRYSYKQLLLFEKKKRPVYCVKSAEELSVVSLLEKVYGPPAPAYSGNLKPELYLVYCKVDSSWGDRLKKHLSCSNSIFQIWDDASVPFGANAFDERLMALSRSKVVVILVSADYYVDPICTIILPHIREAMQKGQPVYWVPIGATSSNHPFAKYRPLGIVGSPLNLMNRSEADRELVHISESLCALLKK